MRPDAPRFLFTADAGRRLELVLYTADREAWTLTLSPGMERFIGHYPRVDGIDSGAPLLAYRAVHAAG